MNRRCSAIKMALRPGAFRVQNARRDVTEMSSLGLAVTQE